MSRRAPFAIASVVLACSLLALGCSSGDEDTAIPPGAQPVAASGSGEGIADVSTVAGVRVNVTQIGAVTGIPTAATEDPTGAFLLVARVTGQVMQLRLERRGEVIVPVPQDDPVLDVSSRTQFDGQNRGLLGMVFSGDGSRLVVSYTDLSGAITVESFAWAGGAPVSLDTGIIAASVPHPLAGLSGGGIDRLPDGDLVLTIGDMDVKYTTPPSAQDLTSPLGAVTRIPAAALTAGGEPAPVTSEQVLAKGLRNPWGVSVDPRTSDIWLGDVGDQRAEEINRIPGATLGDPVVNFGWPYLEGSLPKVEGMPDGLQITPAVIERGHEFEVCGAVGGAVYRGPRIPALAGAYVYGDLCSSEIRAAAVRDGAVIDQGPIGGIDQKVVQFGRGTDGEVYVLGIDGGVYRMDPSSWSVAPLTGLIGRPDTAPTSSTTTIDPGAAPPAACGMVDVFAELDSLTTLPPDEIRARVDRAQVLVANAAAGPPSALTDDIREFQRLFEISIAFGASKGWDFADPELAAYYADVFAGRGQFVGYSDLLNRLITELEACPGRKL